MQRRSMLLVLAFAAILLGTLGVARDAQAQACTHLGAQVTCPSGVTPGSTSLFFFNGGASIQWSNGVSTLTSLCCSPFVVIVPVTPTTPTTPSTSVGTGTPGTPPSVGTVISPSNVATIFGGAQTTGDPSLSFWAGQRFYRPADVHIADYFYFNNLIDPSDRSTEREGVLNDYNKLFLTPNLRETGGFVPVGVVVDDLTRDNLVDVIALNRGSGNVSTNLASGAAADIGTVNAGGFTPVSVTTDRLNDDAFMDIAVANSSGGIEILNESLVTTLLQPLRSVPVGVSPITLSRVADFSQDGFPDFAVATTRGAAGASGQGAVPNVTVLLNRPDVPGNFSTQPPIPLLDRPGFGGANYIVGVADFNADGSPDIITSGPGASNPFQPGASDRLIFNGNGGLLFLPSANSAPQPSDYSAALVSNLYAQYLGRTPAGAAPTQTGGTAPAFVQQLYADLLNRPAAAADQQATAAAATGAFIQALYGDLLAPPTSTAPTGEAAQRAAFVRQIYSNLLNRQAGTGGTAANAATRESVTRQFFTDLQQRPPATGTAPSSNTQEAWRRVSRLGLPLINENVRALQSEISAGCAAAGAGCAGGVSSIQLNPTDGRVPVVTFTFGRGRSGATGRPQQWGRVIVNPDLGTTAQVLTSGPGGRLRSVTVAQQPADGAAPGSLREAVRQTMLLVGNETAGTQRVARPLQQASIGDGSFRAAVEASDAGANRVGDRLPIEGRTYLPVVMKPNLPPPR